MNDYNKHAPRICFCSGCHEYKPHNTKCSYFVSESETLARRYAFDSAVKVSYRVVWFCEACTKRAQCKYAILEVALGEHND